MKSPLPTRPQHLAIIGAGQLGSRHLQGLARLAIPCEIDVVDPSMESLDVARQRFGEMPTNKFVAAVRYHTSIAALPHTLDYVVVATAANVRLGVLRTLLEHATVRFTLLEKVLFQQVGDYAEAERLIDEHGVRAWVNCPRRAWPIYAELREFFASDAIRHFEVRGGGWGLGCNSIHFLDLLGMLTESSPLNVSPAALDGEMIPSKRLNFQEFTGTLRGHCVDGAEFELSSLAGSTARLLLTIRAERRSVVVDEAGGCAFLFDTEAGQGWTRRDFAVPFLSALVTSLATQILETGGCPLATFTESVTYHLPLVGALATHSALAIGTPPGFCPIT